MKEIRLYGFLGQRFGRRFYFDVATPAEAVRALCANFRDFAGAISSHAPGFRVLSGADRLDETALRDPVAADRVIRIVPVVGGAKNGLGQIILGAALIVASFYIPGAWAIGSFSVSTAVAGMGFSMMMGGVSQMLFAPPKPAGPPDRPENKPSYVFDGAINTAAQGNPVPVCYGKLIVGSQVISAGLAVDQI